MSKAEQCLNCVIWLTFVDECYPESLQVLPTLSLIKKSIHQIWLYLKQLKALDLDNIISGNADKIKNIHLIIISAFSANFKGFLRLCLYLNYNKLFPVLNENNEAKLWAYYICVVIQYRWKGENVATTEVADHLLMVDCVEEANVYGVKVPGNNYIISNDLGLIKDILIG